MERGYKEPVDRVFFFFSKLNGLLLRGASPLATGRADKEVSGDATCCVSGRAVRMLVLFRVPCEVDGDRGARGKPQTAACQPVGPLQGRPVWWLGPALSYATGKS